MVGLDRQQWQLQRQPPHAFARHGRVELPRLSRLVRKALAARGIMAGDGDFYANRALRAMGVDPNQGVLRLSFVHYTNQAEIDKLLNALDDLL